MASSSYQDLRLQRFEIPLPSIFLEQIIHALPKLSNLPLHILKNSSDLELISKHPSSKQEEVWREICKPVSKPRFVFLTTFLYLKLVVAFFCLPGYWWVCGLLETYLCHFDQTSSGSLQLQLGNSTSFNALKISMSLPLVLVRYTISPSIFLRAFILYSTFQKRSIGRLKLQRNHWVILWLAGS